MMTKTMHDLPFIGSESCWQIEMSKRIGFVVDEVVADAKHTEQQYRTTCCCNV